MLSKPVFTKNERKIYNKYSNSKFKSPEEEYEWAFQQKNMF